MTPYSAILLRRDESKSTREKFKMPRICVVGGCNNTKQDHTILHLWPRDTKLANMWTKFVQRTRSDWKSGPSKYSYMCSAHFTEHSYTQPNYVAATLGFKPKLKPDAYPTVLPPKILKSKTETTERPLASTSAENGRAGVHVDVKQRSAFRKREFSRMLQTSATDSDVDCTAKQIKVLDDEVNTTDISIMADTLDTNPADGRQARDKKIQVNLKPRRRSKGVSTQRILCVDAEVQCDLIGAPPLQLFSTEYHQQEQLSDEEIIEEIPLNDTDDKNLSTFDPRDCIDELSSNASICTDFEKFDQIRPPHQQQVYLVYEDCLLELFTVCPNCKSECAAGVDLIIGSLVKVKQHCLSCDFKRSWDSQPFINNTPAGNVMLSSAMLFSGACIAKTLRIFNHLGALAISYKTFTNHQRYYLIPAIEALWKSSQTAILEELKSSDVPLSVAADGRADSPGHSAKFGSYSLLETQHNRILHMELVTVTEVSNSNQMEKEGLVRTLQFLKSQGVTVHNIVTDRHVSIRKYLRENQPDITHFLDVWHVAKGLGKKIDQLGRQKGMELVKQWKKSITHHMYWCASSNQEANQDLILAKWESIVGHLQGQHLHSNSLFPTCLHGPLVGAERKKKWFKPNTPDCEKLMMILESTRVKKDVAMLSPDTQTSHLEAYHAVVNHFAPKLTSFSVDGMKARLQLASLHFNENSSREQATSVDGQQQFSLEFKKFNHGDATLKKVLVSCTYNYVEVLKDIVVRLVERDEKCCVKKQGPSTIASSLKQKNISKDECIKLHHSRYA